MSWKPSDDDVKAWAQINALTPVDFATRGPVIKVRGQRTLDLGNGQKIDMPHESVVDRDLCALDRLKDATLVRARATRAGWLVAVAHILAAVSRALHEHDFAALNAPHKWARRRLKPAGRWVFDKDYIPCEDAKGRLTQAPSPGLDILVRVLTDSLTACRPRQAPLTAFADDIALCAAYNFPGVSSLDLTSGDYLERLLSIRERMRVRLAELDSIWATTQPRSAAPEIAEALLRDELKLSGRSDAQIERDLQFLKMRASRSSSGE